MIPALLDDLISKRALRVQHPVRHGLGSVSLTGSRSCGSLSQSLVRLPFSQTRIHCNRCYSYAMSRKLTVGQKLWLSLRDANELEQQAAAMAHDGGEKTPEAVSS